MSKKQILTNVEIEKDIVNALENPPYESEDSYQKRQTPKFIILCVLIIINIALAYPIFLLWETPTLVLFSLLISLIVFFVSWGVFSIFCRIRRRCQIKRVSISDYDITTEVVHSIFEEHYTARRGRYYTAQIDNYGIRFENQKEWRIPPRNYLWSEFLRMYDSQIYAATHREDTVVVVTDKRTGEIVMAYHTDIFEYVN